MLLSVSVARGVCLFRLNLPVSQETQEHVQHSSVSQFSVSPPPKKVAKVPWKLLRISLVALFASFPHALGFPDVGFDVVALSKNRVICPLVSS